MTASQDFDRALNDSLLATDESWTDNIIFLLCATAARLNSEDLEEISRMWPSRSLLWQQHCAEVIGSNRLDPAIELLLSMMDHGRPAVALTALGSLQEFDPRRFSSLQTERIRSVLDTALEQSVPLLQRVVLEAFVATLQLSHPPQ